MKRANNGGGIVGRYIIRPNTFYTNHRGNMDAFPMRRHY